MAFSVVSLLPFLFIIAIVYFFVIKRNKATIGSLMIRFNRKSHFSILIGYVVLLVVVLFISEVVEQKTIPPVQALTELDYPELDHALSIAEIHDVHFLEKRTHPVSQTLSVDNSHGEAFIYVERKKKKDGIIEEFIFHPTVFINEHNRSHKMKVAKPIWQNNTMAIPKQPFNDIFYASFHDSAFLSQMTNAGVSSTRSSFSNNSISGILTIYLLIPDDVEIDATFEEYIEYIK